MLLDEIPTHITPSYSVHPITGDEYTAYNKPFAIQHWLEHANPAEDFVLIVDPDMVFFRPIVPGDYQIGPGHAAAMVWERMHGACNELGELFASSVTPQPSLGSPRPCRGDRVGAPYVLHRTDLFKLAPYWLNITADMRGHRTARKHDLQTTYFEKHYGHPSKGLTNRPSWLTEMYGYIFGAARLGISHSSMGKQVDMYLPWDDQKEYALGWDGTTSNITIMPLFVHYMGGADITIPGTRYRFTKKWFDDHNPTVCQHWVPFYGNSKKERPLSGPLMPQIILKKKLRSLSSKGEHVAADVLKLAMLSYIDQGLCLHYRRHCPLTPELDSKCGEVEDFGQILERSLQLLRMSSNFSDLIQLNGELSEGHPIRGFVQQHASLAGVAALVGFILWLAIWGSNKGTTVSAAGLRRRKDVGRKKKRG